LLWRWGSNWSWISAGRECAGGVGGGGGGASLCVSVFNSQCEVTVNMPH